MLYLGLEIGTQQIRITRDSLSLVSLFGSTEVQWAAVEEIYIPPAFGYTFGFGYNLTVVAKNPKRPGRLRRVGLPASLYSNRHLLVKAVLEAAYINNSNSFVAVNGTVKQTYGLPPYGIFTDG
ncbi:hypothetical protein Mterra_01603 [Calidithermus terrae]|uniref:Uncharacterized protein n=1 Tax=Calidithermus terrae TaxID=1408545 RepID=A0A399EQM9_9DEIN|nr:PH domain-containing protein [Calidithermus terrae]RIH85846.1 hypothetical protein Mterra_01603 [Calidithermus terrae]